MHLITNTYSTGTLQNINSDEFLNYDKFDLLITSENKALKKYNRRMKIPLNTFILT